MQKKCFFSVLSKDFIQGFKVFSKSLLKNNPWLKITETEMVLVSVDLSETEKIYCKSLYKHIKWLEPEKLPKNFNNIEENGYQGEGNVGKCAVYKLQAFSLYDYDLVVSIDVGDMVVTKPIPEIFSFNTPIGMTQGWTKSHGWHCEKKSGGTFNGGLVILNKEHRNKKTYENLINHKPCPYFDQQVINNTFKKKISKLPIGLNFSKRMIECEELDIEEAKIIHYVGEKPWQRYKGKIKYKSAEKFWTDYNK